MTSMILRTTRFSALGPIALAGLLSLSCEPAEISVVRSEAVPVAGASAGTVVGGFVLLATGRVSVDDRTGLNPQITGGDVGAAGVGIPPSSPTVVVGSAATVDGTRVVIGERVVLRDRAAIGPLRASQVTAPHATYTSLSPYAAPPAVPSVGSFTAGTVPLIVNAGQTVQLAPGKKGAVLVRGTLQLTGGLYELASLTLENDARLIARARSVVRIAQGARAGDRVRISLATTALNAGDLRFIVAGVNAGTTSSITLGNDNAATGLFLGSGAVTAGDRLVAVGAFAGRDVIVGHDAKITFQVGFDCNADAACADSTTCTTDRCTDAQCAHAPVTNGTACNDGNACTQTDLCQAGACVGSNPKVCAALDQCHLAGACSPATGICTDPSAADGTTCNDTNTCTQSDTCQAGVCRGSALTCSTPQSCGALGVCALKPVLNCVIDQGSAGFVAYFGFENRGDAAIAAAIGPSNGFSPGPTDRDQPTSFIPGTVNQWVLVPFDGTPLTWTLGNGQATASSGSPRCPPFPADGDDDTEDNGDLAKFPAPVPAQAPDPSQIPEVTSNNLFPRVSVRIVPRPPEALPSLAGASDEHGAPLLAFLEHGRATRSVEVVLLNNTDQVLSFVDGQFEGESEGMPPGGIQAHSYGDWQSGSDGFAQGTGGFMIYSFAGKQLRMDWDNPFIGSNDYSQSITGPGASDFTVDRVGGEGNRSTIFFILRRTIDAATNCPFPSHQWLVDSLHSPEDALSGIDTASGFISTPAKNILGVGKWATTGCFAPRVVGRVIQTAHSTDRFFTIDVVLDEFDGTFLTDSGKAVRIEVAPFGLFGLKTNPAHRAIVNGGLPPLGSRIVFSGTVLIDHGSFLEVHPAEPIQIAKACSDFAPGEPLPLYCNQTLNDFFTWAGGQPPTPMGRANGRACFLTGMKGAFQSASDEIHVSLDASTNNWFLSGAGSVNAQARCTATSAIISTGTWSQGEPPLRLGPTSASQACFLTRIAGHFEGGGETVGISEVIDMGVGTGSQTLSGQSQQDGVSATATCIATRSVSFPHGWGQGNPTTPLHLVSGPTGFSSCFLIQAGGDFEGGGESVQIGATTTASGALIWTLGGLSQQQEVKAGAQCMNP